MFLFQAMPELTIEITDAEGDLGFIGKDTAFIYMKNLLTGKFDSTLDFLIFLRQLVRILKQMW